MRWFSVEVILSMRPVRGRVSRWAVFDNVYLIRARSRDEAVTRAEAIGDLEASQAGDGLTVAGRPAAMVFEGVRAVREVQSDAGGPNQSDGELASGSEIACIEYTLDSDRALHRLLHGRSVAMVLRHVGREGPTG